MNHWVEISQAQLVANLHATRAAAGDHVDVLAVIKADAYGHDATLCAPVIAAAGVSWLGVTDAEEGAAVRTALGENTTRIMVMSGMKAADAPMMFAHRLTPVVWTSEHIAALEAAAQAANQPIAVHVEVDTGMARQGAPTGIALRDLLAQLAASQWVICEGIMTHLCCSEVAGARTTATAQQRFTEVLRDVAAAGLHPAWVHIGNSSALDEGTTMTWISEQAGKLNARALVRTGLAVYGYCLPIEGESGHPHLQPALQHVMIWKASILNVRQIDPGTSVGYGATFTAQRKMTLALLGAGYADGFRREASSGIGDGWVIIDGQRAPIVGRVSMNLTIVDVSAIPTVTTGTEAILLGSGVTAEDHARWANTIPYEILCGVRGHRVLV